MSGSRDPSRSPEPKYRDQLVTMKLSFHLIFSGLIRLLLLGVGVLYDSFQIKPSYTDVDYSVFTDGAYYMNQKRSPFLREGFRYSPLIALINLPNLWWFNCFGKLVFIACDLFTGLLIYKILLNVKASCPQILRITKSGSINCAIVWLYNPLTLVISTRGSSDSIITFLVLLAVNELIKRNYVTAGLVYGLVVHFKQYPIIYAPVIFVFLRKYDNVKPLTVSQIIHRLNPFSLRRIVFFVSFLLSFVGITYYCYLLYGDRYLYEGWIYHLKRIDRQHNFSVYFYVYHLVGHSYEQLVARLAFLPQLAVGVACACYVLNGTGLADSTIKLLYALFAETFWFVNLNKVITSQYFVWYFALFPLLVPFFDKQLTGRRLTALLAVWLIAQGQWLLPAYLFEFRKLGWAFHWTGVASFAFLMLNLAIFRTLSSRFSLKMRSE